MQKYYKKFYEAREITGKYRILPVREPCSLVPQVDFSSNDYLGLAKSAKLLDAGVRAAQQFGVGATGSRLLSGNSQLLTEFEAEIAKCKKTESALIFNSGFQANSSVLASLLDQRVLSAPPLVFFDRLNHASLYQGVLTSNARLMRYKHCDMNHLHDLLKKHQNYPGPKFIVSETVFGMDGDCAPLANLVELAKNYRALLYLDEAHATGVTGSCGYGMSADVDMSEVDYVVMGTFSKGLGCAGAYVACSAVIKKYLINHCAGFIYTTALSPMLVGVMQAAWREIPLMDKARLELQNLSEFARQQFKKIGIDIGNSVTNIIPIIIGCENKTLRVKEDLLQSNIIVSAVRPPTVPPKTARLRVALRVGHIESNLEVLITKLKSI